MFAREPLQPFHDASAATVVQDHRGDVWAAITALGAYRFRADGRVDRYAVEHGLPPGRVLSLIEDRAYTIWIGTEQGLCHLRPRGDDGDGRYEVARVYGHGDGLPPYAIWGLLESADGVLWVSTAGGLAQFDGTRFHTSPLQARERLWYGAPPKMSRETSGQARMPAWSS